MIIDIIVADQWYITSVYTHYKNHYIHNKNYANPHRTIRGF